MAISALLVGEIRTTGADDKTQSGGFVAGASGSDYSQQSAAQYSGTDLVIDGALNTKVTSATHTFDAADVGNLIAVSAGTGFTVGHYEILSVAAGAATLDRAVGTVGSTGGTFAVGGAFASPGYAFSIMIVGGQDVYIKSGTYTISSTTSNISGGRVTTTGGVAASSNAQRFIGYQTTRGDNGTKPIIRSSVNSIVMVTASVGLNYVDNIEIDGNLQTSNQGISFANTYNQAIRLKVMQCTNLALTTSGYMSIISCEFTGCTTGSAVVNVGSSGYVAITGCNIHDNTVTGILSSGPVYISFCIIETNTGASTDGVVISHGTYSVWNCTFYANGRHGLSDTQSANTDRSKLIQDCIAVSNGGWGFSAGNAIFLGMVRNCAHFGNVTGGVDTDFTYTEGTVVLTGDPFTNAAAGDFSLNNTAGAGADCRRASTIGVFPGGLSTGYMDIGAVQVGDTPAAGGGGGTSFSRMRVGH